MAKPIILACVNLKGGVGKTTLAVNLAAYCGRKRLSTLLVDLDPQTNATLSCISLEQWQEHAAAHGTVADLLGVRNHANAEGAEKTAGEVILEGVFENVDLLPSHLDLFTVDLDLGGATAREQRLRKSLKPVWDDYDIIICDCPPNLTIPTQNALAVCNYYLVPVSPDFLSSLGIGLLLNRVGQLSSDLDNEIELVGIAISRYGRKSNYREQTVETLRQNFDNVLETVLVERTAVMEAVGKNMNVFQTKDTEAIAEFSGICKEILEKLELS